MGKNLFYFSICLLYRTRELFFFHSFNSLWAVNPQDPNYVSTIVWIRATVNQPYGTILNLLKRSAADIRMSREQIFPFHIRKTNSSDVPTDLTYDPFVV